MAKDKDDPRTIVLSDGKELRVDLNAMTWPEVREMLRGAPYDKDEEADAANRVRYAGGLGKFVGLSAGEVLDLGFLDFRRIEGRIIDALKDPLAFDPN